MKITEVFGHHYADVLINPEFTEVTRAAYKGHLEASGITFPFAPPKQPASCR